MQTVPIKIATTGTTTVTVESKHTCYEVEKEGESGRLGEMMPPTRAGLA